MRKGFVAVAAIMAGAGLLLGAGVHPAGKWPLAGILLADTALVAAWLCFRERAGRVYEMVELTTHELRLTRVLASGRALSWTFNPYWVRLQFEDGGSGAVRLCLRSHGRELTFGNFLSRAEKRGLAAALGAALHAARGARF
jgi:uncharacterized membrane protein